MEQRLFRKKTRRRVKNNTASVACSKKTMTQRRRPESLFIRQIHCIWRKVPYKHFLFLISSPVKISVELNIFSSISKFHSYLVITSQVFDKYVQILYPQTHIPVNILMNSRQREVSWISEWKIKNNEPIIKNPNKNKIPKNKVKGN